MKKEALPQATIADSVQTVHAAELAAILDAIRQLMAPATKPHREIEFHVRERTPRYRSRSRR